VSFEPKEQSILGNALLALLKLPEQEKAERGLLHTPREIYQQPQTWKSTYQRCQDLRSELKAALDRVGIGSSSPTVYLVGAGTSDYVGRALAPLLRRRWGGEVWAVASTTLLTEFDQYHRPNQKYLWISFSRSGDSPEGVALLERAINQHPQVQHLLITCNQRGAMAQLCSRHPDRALAVILDDAVNDRGLAMTSSFTNMVIAGQCLSNLDSLKDYGDVLAQMVDAGTRFMPLASEAASTITALDCSRACFVGAGSLRAAADESADFPLTLGCGPDFPDDYRPVLDIIFGQLLGLFTSLRCGLKPDQPSPSGAITRVVSPIKLYT
jgi:tagatose-6-phosphate ketose/aldose isomerase